MYNLEYDNDIDECILPERDSNYLSVANTKAIGKGDNDDEDGPVTTATVFRSSSALDSAVSLEDLGYSKCGYHLND